MDLQSIASGGPAVSISLLGGEAALARQIQERLADLHLLDPPADGNFGPVSHWALAALLRRMEMASKKEIDREVARALLDDAVLELFPLRSTQTLAGRLVKAAQDQGYWLCRHPECSNIVYIEGMDADGTVNGNVPNEFNDLRVALRVNKAGNPEIVECWEGTTEPGRYYVLVEKLDPRGAARIAFGQYKAWSVGTHMAGRPSAHEALVQTLPIPVYRDLDTNFRREGDTLYTGIFGVNQHWGFDLKKSDIGRASAGCLVGRTKAGHRAFMAICKSDPRYQSSNAYRFMTTVLSAAEVH